MWKWAVAIVCYCGLIDIATIKISEVMGIPILSVMPVSIFGFSMVCLLIIFSRLYRIDPYSESNELTLTSLELTDRLSCEPVPVVVSANPRIVAFSNLTKIVIPKKLTDHLSTEELRFVLGRLVIHRQFLLDSNKKVSVGSVLVIGMSLAGLTSILCLFRLDVPTFQKLFQE